jgi:protein TonB
MNESTARAERYDLQTSLSPFYLWEVPQKPVSVRVPFSLIDRLEREAVESFRSLTSKGSEIGGLLVGAVTPGSPLVVSIADYELITCDYSRGPLYRLSDADMGRFERAIEQRTAAGAAIAGFFRSQTRKGLALDTDDLTFFEARFRDPHQIALLVRPFATKASAAGIFIWENGKVNGDASYLEFPFRSSELGIGNTLPDPPESKAGATPAPKAPPARGQIVPIASRREISIPHPTAPEAAPAPPAVTPAPAVATAPPTAGAPAVEAKPAVTEEKPKIEKAPKTEVKPESKTEAKTESKPESKTESKPDKADKSDKSGKVAKTEKTEKVEKVEAPVKAEKQEKQEKKETKEAKEAARGAVSLMTAPEPEKSGKSMKLLVAAAATIIAFVVLFVYPGYLRSHNSKPQVTANHQDSSALQLHVERTAGELLITWNRDADAIKNASKAVLSISDGAQHENVEMDLAQLRNGSIVYAPSSKDTSFKMEVVDKSNVKTASESVRVLDNRPSPLENQPAAVTPAPVTTATKPAATPDPKAAAPTAAAEETPAEAPTRLASPSKPFQAESLSQRLRPAAATDMPDAPSVGGSGNSFASAIPGVNANAVAPAPVAPTAPSVPVPTPAAQTSAANAKAGGQIQQAVLIYRKEAEYPKIAKQTGAKGVVTLNATITKEGTVKNVKVVSGHPMLVNAAAEAVRQWKYKPTLLNGQPVETDTQILVNFVGER